MKIFKKVIIAIFLIVFGMITIGLVKYNRDLNAYIDSGNYESSHAPNLKPEEPSQVHIIGTVHNESDKIKRADLYKMIDAIGPDVILFELEPDKVRRMVNRSDYLLQLWKVFRNQNDLMEEAVTLKYIYYNPNCLVRSYEWEVRTKYKRRHKIQARSQALLEAVVRLYSQGELTEDQSARVKKYIEQSRALKPINENAVLSDLNNTRTDSLLRERQYSQYKHMADVASERLELSQFEDFLDIFRNYWDIRNKAMVQNILNQIEQRPNSKFVVLNGYYHRYYLIDGLKPYESEYGFEIVED